MLLTGIGISKDLIDQETTALPNSNGDIGTRMYSFPEILSEGRRRGRAADIYSLGCVFLEISAVLLGPGGGLKKWSCPKNSVAHIFTRVVTFKFCNGFNTCGGNVHAFR